MGAKASKNPQEEEEEENRVHEPYLIQWDEFGHLRYGNGANLIHTVGLSVSSNFRIPNIQVRLIRLIPEGRWLK
jgi:hypothetical protein